MESQQQIWNMMATIRHGQRADDVKQDENILCIPSSETNLLDPPLTLLGI